MILPNEFETYLNDQITSLQESKVRDAMAYSLMNGGKRIRPQLLLSTLQAYGNDPKLGFPCASAIEMIHTYSLIHDDLPAMDNDDLRRGKPSCHKAFGEDIAILAGDGLLTKAFAQVLKTDCSYKQKCEMVSLLSSYAGAEGMIYGQELDLLAEDDTHPTLEKIYAIDAYKTAKLLTLPLLCGAILSDASKDIPTLKKIGYTLGVLFQIQDDILDVTTSSEVLGKSTSDDENDKKTTVSLLGLDQAKQLVETLSQEMELQLQSLSIQTQPLSDLFSMIIQRTY